MTVLLSFGPILTFILVLILFYNCTNLFNYLYQLVKVIVLLDNIIKVKNMSSTMDADKGTNDHTTSDLYERILLISVDTGLLNS